MMNSAVLGANGAIGSAIMREAPHRGHRVTAGVRDPEKADERHADLSVTTGDVLDPQSVTAAAKGRDVVVSTVVGGGAGSLRTPTASRSGAPPTCPTSSCRSCTPTATPSTTTAP
ncbi:putative NAD(P)-binding protein [Streptomyces sp. BK208]|nr:putative NAD(P)-binding protein [Streptomyces sp. BK208]